MERRIPVAQPDIGVLEREYVADAVRSGWVSSLGPYLTRFEDEFARFGGTREALTVSNGTSGLLVALRALDVGRGAEVLVPALTFAAAPAAVASLGGEPVLVDVDDTTWCMDPVAAELAITPRTRAVIAVHSYGHPADMEALTRLCQRHQVHLIEDCAEAHGARYRGRPVGSMGVAGVFSFYGNKIITTGEGGMVTTDDATLAERVRFLRDHAMDPTRRYYHSEVGYNFRLTNLQAAMGCAQLARAEAMLAKRAQVLDWYREELADCEHLALNPSMPWAEPVNWMVCCRLPHELKDKRDELLAALGRRGVDTRPFFVPLAHLPPYRSSRRVSRDGAQVLPVAQDVGESGFNLPSSSLLERDDVSYVCDAVRSVLGQLALPRRR